MKVTKSKKILIFILCLFLIPIVFYKLEGTKTYWIKDKEDSIGRDCLDIFIVQNPPSSKEEIIKFIESVNDTLNVSVDDKKLYAQSFYKETFNLTRFYKPYYASFTGNYVNIREDDQLFAEEHIADCIYRDPSYNEDYGDKCPIFPFYRIYKEGSLEYEYYPKGIKNNPKLRWKSYRNENSITKIGDVEYKN